jgi:hypothetical protein
VEPPRSFILSHELVGVPQRRSSYPVLRLATTLAAFAFIALVGVDAVTTNFGGTRSSQSMDQVVAELPALAESEALGAAKIEALEPEAALESQPAEMLAGAEALAETVEGEALAMAPEPEQTSDAVVQEEGRAAEGERATEPEADAVPALESPQEDTAGTLSATEYPAQDLMENQLELSGDNDQVMTFAQPESGLSLRSTNPWLRGVEIGLGGLALLLGALTVWARKRPI